MKGHQHGVWNLLLLTPHILVSSGFDETIRVWDMQTEANDTLPSEQSMAYLSGHKHQVKEMVLTHNHNYFITLDKAGRLISWPIV